MVSFFKRTAAPAALTVIAVSLGGCMGTTYGTGVSPGAQTLSDIGGLVDLGGHKSPPIDYKPRPPLVAPPPGASPPPPGSNGVASAGDWPHDPDLSAKGHRDDANKTAAVGRGSSSAEASALYDPGLKIPIQHDKSVYWTKKGLADGSASAGTKEQDAETRKRMAAARSVVSVDDKGNPVRKTLADPPVVYREPDPNAPADFKTSKKKFHWPWQASPDSGSAGLVDDSGEGKSPIANRSTQNEQMSQ
jgi:hypothetical protein